MATDPKETTPERRSEHRLGDLGFTRIPAEEDPRRKNPELLAAVAKIAPGTGLREAVDDVIRSHEGALIVVGDPHRLSFLYSGGIQLDAPSGYVHTCFPVSASRPYVRRLRVEK